MWKYVIGFVCGVVLTNAWQHVPQVRAERMRSVVTNQVTVGQVVEVVPESLMIFETGVIYRIVKNVGHDASVEFEIEWNRFPERRLWSQRPELKKFSEGTRFYLTADRKKFVVLGRGSV